VDRAGERRWRQGEKPMIEPRKVTGDSDTKHHARNFLDCVKSRRPCNCDIETGHRSTSATLLANVAHQTRTLLEWDAKREAFTNNPSANRLLDYEYRAGYRA
jgi:hypothetical protein